jgi:hypothetical protein
MAAVELSSASLLNWRCGKLPTNVRVHGMKIRLQLGLVLALAFPFGSTAMDLPIVRGLFTGARDSLTN